MPNRIPTPGVPTPAVRKSPAAQKPMTGDAAIKEYQRQVSPSGVASAAAANRKAIDQKYPGLYKMAPTPTAKPKAK